MGLTHTYAHLLANECVTGEASAPALVETEIVTRNPNARRDLIPVGPFGPVEETSDVTVMPTRNGCITGQTSNVSGGWCMRQVGGHENFAGLAHGVKIIVWCVSVPSVASIAG